MGTDGALPSASLKVYKTLLSIWELPTGSLATPTRAKSRRVIKAIITKYQHL